MRRAGSFTLGLTLLIGLVAVPGTSAAAGTAHESYRVPASGVLRLSGHGLGHGIGMSQFGAQGMGLVGKSYRQILRFYFPGTGRAAASAKLALRVSLSGLAGSGVSVQPRPGLRASLGREPVTLPGTVGGRPVTAYRVSRSADGLVVRALTRDGAAQLASGPGPLSWSTAPSLRRSRFTVVTPSGVGRSYHGRLLVRGKGNDLLVVDVLRLEDYLRSVVSLEVPGGWTPAALRAQAVAARSYALLLRHNARAAGQRFDICDTTACQAFGGIDTESAPEAAAVADTVGEYLTSGGEPALTQFSASNGGWTVAGGRSYLVARRDPYDGVVTGTANWGHSWKQTVTATSIERAYPSIGRLRAVRVLGRDGNGDWGGRVQAVGLVGTRGTTRVSGDELRWALGLRSTWWTVTKRA